jgi:hypothetical protein
MTKYIFKPPDFIKAPTHENGCYMEQFEKESKNPLRNDVLRCPLCNSRDLDLHIENHFKAETEYIIKCGCCTFKQRNPFFMGYGYLAEEAEREL